MHAATTINDSLFTHAGYFFSIFALVLGLSYTQHYLGITALSESFAGDGAAQNILTFLDELSFVDAKLKSTLKGNPTFNPFLFCLGPLTHV
jgi:hypothetical protein